MRHLKVVPFLVVVLLTSAFSQDRPTSPNMELVIDRGGDGTDETKIYSLDFKDDSTLRVLFSHERDTIVAQIGGEENSFTFPAAMLAHNAASLAGNTVIGLAPLQAEVFDIERQRTVKTLKVDGIDAWPLACEGRGLCAWQSGQKVHVEPVGGIGKSFNFGVGESAVLSLDISPDRQFLAVGVNEARVRVWRLTDGQELKSLPMEATPDSSLLGASELGREVVPRSFVFPRPGMATVVRFSPDGSVFAAANETGVHLWNVKTWERLTVLRGYRGRVSAISFADSRSVAVASEDRVVRLYQFGQQTNVVEVCRLAAMPHFLALRKDGAFVAAGFADGSIELWNTGKKALGLRVRLFADGWIATTPSGLFDTSEQIWHHASWVFHGKENTRVPIEAFYQNFYWAGLVSSVLKGEPIPDGPKIENLILDLPQVQLTAVETKAAKAELVPGQGIRNVPERIRFRVQAKPGGLGGEIADLQIALNGIVVKKWPGKQALLQNGSSVQEVELEMPPGDISVSAYAYNESKLRSTDTVESVWKRPMQGFGYPIPQRTLFVLGIGIGKYKNSKFNLDFADSDVLRLARTLGLSDAELQDMSRRVLEWTNKRTFETLQTARQYEIPARVQIKTLLNEQATKTEVIGALRELAKTAQPKDAVLVYYAGHGISDQNNYYMLPWDMALPGVPGAINRVAVSAARATLISDDEIAAALAELNVKYGALILDSCYSGQALEGAGLLGPINPQGLTGWAYEKGINLLAASEASAPSFELKKLGSSVLFTALVSEGLLKRKADARPLDGTIELEEWLRYAVSRLPSLVRESSGAQAQGSVAQSARLAPSRIARQESLVLAAADKEP